MSYIYNNVRACGVAIAVAGIVAVGMFQSCKPSGNSGDDTYDTPRGMPTLIADEPVYDEQSQTFALTLTADSVADATLTYYLLDGDKILSENADGHFTNIAPLDEGYNIQLRAEWRDTTITTPPIHVMGFIVPRPQVEKMSLDDVQKAINAKMTSFKTGTDEHLAQKVNVTVVGSTLDVHSLLDVIDNLELGAWHRVIVTDLRYDDTNHITDITLTVEGETIGEDDFEEEW